MVKKTKQMDKFKIIITFWILIFIVAISSLFSLILLKKQIDEYENDSNIKIELVQLTNQFLNASDYLTNHIKAFTVTADPKHLDNYWREVDISKNREKIIDRIRQFKILAEEINLISESKKNSDSLVQTEILAMKLIVEAYDIPLNLTHQIIQNHELSRDDTDLAPGNQVLRAQEVIFSNYYTTMKKNIYAPILSFQNKIIERVDIQMKTSMQKIDTLYYALFTQLLIIIGMVAGSVWLRLLLIKEKKLFTKGAA